MSITFISVGSFVNGTSTTITPVAGTFAAGDALLLFTGEFMGTQTIATPAGWTVLDRNVNAQQTRVFGKIATGGDTIPSLTWGSGSIAWAFVAAFRGVDPSFSVGAAANDRAASITNPNIIGPASSVTPGFNNCLAIFYGQRNKTTTTNGVIYSAPANFTMLAQQANNGAVPSIGVSYWIQTTATAVPANISMTGSTGAESANQSMQGGVIVLQSGTPVVGGTGSRLSLMGVGA